MRPLSVISMVGRWRRGWSQLVLNLDARRRCAINITSWPLHSRERTLVLAEQKNIFPLLAFEPQTVQPESHYHTDYPILTLVSYAKGKVHPKAQRYSSTLSLTSPLDGVGGQRHVPAALPRRKTRYPLYRRRGGSQSRAGQVQKISPPHQHSILGPSSP
jgi:hypothetical protein